MRQVRGWFKNPVLHKESLTTNQRALPKGGAQTSSIKMKMKFASVNYCVTSNASRKFNEFEIITCLSRHLSGDWGNLVKDDKLANERALKTGDRILSSYKFGDGRKMWIITDAENDNGVRELTTVLLPSDY